MKRKYSIAFDQLPVGNTFSMNGNRWMKRSTRTAEIVKPVDYAGQWFYFSMNERVIIKYFIEHASANELEFLETGEFCK